VQQDSSLSKETGNTRKRAVDHSHPIISFGASRMPSPGAAVSIRAKPLENGQSNRGKRRVVHGQALWYEWKLERIYAQTKIRRALFDWRLPVSSSSSSSRKQARRTDFFPISHPNSLGTCIENSLGAVCRSRAGARISYGLMGLARGSYA
jgi:hypothetical protein